MYIGYSFSNSMPLYSNRIKPGVRGVGGVGNLEGRQWDIQGEILQRGDSGKK